MEMSERVKMKQGKVRSLNRDVMIYECYFNLFNSLIALLKNNRNNKMRRTKERRREN